jgi:hypothetical protein
MSEPQTHFLIEVYAAGTSPATANAVPMSLCPESREKPVELRQEVAQVTCRRCLQLLDVIGLRPIM